MAEDSAAIQRLRGVIHWASLVFGLVLAAIGALAVWTPPNYGPAIAMAFIGFIVPVLIGRAALELMEGGPD